MGEILMKTGFQDERASFESRAVIKVCGIGGGGSNAITRMIAAGMKEVDFITINTDAQALKNSPAATRIQIGSSGLGAGAVPEKGEQAAEEDRDRIEDVMRGADMIFLTAGLGGGTGTGASPVVAEVAKSTGALTVAVVTLPFSFEGQKRMANAKHGLDELQKHVDALVVVPNDKLTMLCQSNISFLNAFALADEVLHNGVRSISELITTTGLVNLDFADVETIMKNSGRALMGIGSAEGEGRAIRAAQAAIVCPLLENSTIEGAMRVIVNIQGGSDIQMHEVNEAVSTVQSAAHPEANIIFGAVIDEQDRTDIRVTVIAAGFKEVTRSETIFSDSMDQETPLPEWLRQPRAASNPYDFTPRAETAAVTQPVQREERVPQPVPAPKLDWDEELAEATPAPAPAPRQEQKHDFSDRIAVFPRDDAEEDVNIPAFMRNRKRANQ